MTAAEKKTLAEQEKLKRQPMPQEKLFSNSAKAQQAQQAKDQQAKTHQAQQAKKSFLNTSDRQHSATVGDVHLFETHCKEFPHKDKWVPAEFNYEWERFKEEFIKWFYVFSNLPQDNQTKRKAQKFFLKSLPNEALS